MNKSEEVDEKCHVMQMKESEDKQKSSTVMK